MSMIRGSVPSSFEKQENGKIKVGWRRLHDRGMIAGPLRAVDAADHDVTTDHGPVIWTDNVTDMMLWMW